MSIKKHAIKKFKIDGLDCFIAMSPMDTMNGYCIFPKCPTVEPDYNGILTYVPVHGGITYARAEGKKMIYGFDTCHFNSNKYPINDIEWIKGQIAVMIKGIKKAAEIEKEYLLSSSEDKVKYCQEVQDMQPEQGVNFGVMINILGGKI